MNGQMFTPHVIDDFQDDKLVPTENTTASHTRNNSNTQSDKIGFINKPKAKQKYSNVDDEEYHLRKPIIIQEENENTYNLDSAKNSSKRDIQFVSDESQQRLLNKNP